MVKMGLSDVIIDGAHVFFHNEAPRTSFDVENNKILVGGIPGFFDPFVDNDIDLDADTIPDSKVNSFIECNLKKFGGVGDDGADAIFQ